MSFTNLEFIFADIKSSDMGLNIVKIDSGFFGTEVSGGKNLIYDKVAYKDTPYIYRTDLDLMKFTVTLCPLDGLWTDDFKYNIFKWINTRQPQKFETCDYLGKQCYALCINPIELMTAGLQQGYINLEFQSTTPYWLSPVEIKTFDLSDITTDTIITLENKSNVLNEYNESYYYPEVWIDLKSTSTGFSLTNNSDSGRVFSMTTLNTLESLYINNQMKQIVSSTGLSRLSKLVGHRWFRMTFGVNQIKVSFTSKCIIQFRCQFPIMM